MLLRYQHYAGAQFLKVGFIISHRVFVGNGELYCLNLIVLFDVSEHTISSARLPANGINTKLAFLYYSVSFSNNCALFATNNLSSIGTQE